MTVTYTLQPPLPRTATPDDYTRFQFDPSGVPAKRIVGLLACQRDPLLRSLTSRVLTATRAAAAPLAQKGRKKKGSEPASGTATPSGTLWEVELEDTVVFPEGGGQPWDTGVMELVADEANGTADGLEKLSLNGAPSYTIEGCIRRGLSAVHLVRAPADADLSTLVDQTVRVTVDWARRTDHMVTHTGQHLLSAILDKRNLPTLSWAMDPYPSEAAYIEIPRGLTWAEAEEVERECNERIRENRKIWIEISKQGEEEDGGRENRVIPKDYAGGVIRHCNIDGTDRNACCGTQCPSLSHVGFIHVIPPSAPHDATEPTSLAPTRLYFYAGPRAATALGEASRTLSRAAQALRVPRTMLPERTGKMEAARAEGAESNKALRLELAGMLAASPDMFGSSALVVRDSQATHDFEFLNAIASAYFVRLAEEEISDGREEDQAAVLVVISSPPNVSPTMVLVQARDNARGKAIYEQISKLAKGKGGGAKGRFMAKFDEWAGRETVEVKKILAAAA